MPLRIIPDERRTTIKDIAPCGMNCSVCFAAMRKKGKHCPGCRGGDIDKAKSCISYRIRNCNRLNRNAKYCYSCDIFPCFRLKQLDVRYQEKYSMSMIENLNRIEHAGIREFVRSENERWICTSCGKKLCVHNANYPDCGHPWR
ncbi:MAG: DUF3795 domain-containing protein [Fibrobacter sp.]|jgi:hypothetical protein|nr:DUF3795 domain-containing protein [Fibrobacter sp.]